VWQPRKHKHGGCNWVPMMCRIVASPPIWIFGELYRGICRTACVPKLAIRRQWGKLPSANYANRPGTRRNSTSAAKLDQQGAKPLTNRGISTCFRSGRLMAFCENYRRGKHFPRMENVFPWTAERITFAHSEGRARQLATTRTGTFVIFC
jgi:hypothetical protein